MTLTIRWMRELDGALRLYKHDLDLYSEELADPDDEIVVIKAIIRTPPKTIVALPVSRDLLNTFDQESLLRNVETAAFHAAEKLALEIGRGPRITLQPDPPIGLVTAQAGVFPPESEPGSAEEPRPPMSERDNSHYIEPFSISLEAHLLRMAHISYTFDEPQTFHMKCACGFQQDLDPPKDRILFVPSHECPLAP